MYSGNVVDCPEVKFVTMKSSKDSENASIAAATMPGSASGRVTSRKVCHSLAYRSIAACSNRWSSPMSRALTVTTTNDRQNITWAMTIVMNPSTLSRPSDTNIASSEAPMTTSGVAIGRKITRFAVLRPRKLCRTSAKAIRVPRIVASTVAVRLTAMLSRSEAQSPSGSQIDVQLLSVNASNWAVADRPEGWLNDSATMYAIGTHM